MKSSSSWGLLLCGLLALLFAASNCQGAAAVAGAVTNAPTVVAPVEDAKLTPVAAPVKEDGKDTTVEPPPETTTPTPDPKTTTPEPKTTTPDPKTTTPDPKTTTPDPNTTTTTTPDPNTTTTTTPDPKTTTTTTPDPKTTTTTTPDPKTTTTPEPITTTAAPNTTTTIAPPTPNPPCRHFDGPSFIGGIVLTLGLLAIGLVAYKFYKARNERNYHTL